MPVTSSAPWGYLSEDTDRFSMTDVANVNYSAEIQVTTGVDVTYNATNQTYDLSLYGSGNRETNNAIGVGGESELFDYVMTKTGSTDIESGRPDRERGPNPVFWKKVFTGLSASNFPVKIYVKNKNTGRFNINIVVGQYIESGFESVINIHLVSGNTRSYIFSNNTTETRNDAAGNSTLYRPCHVLILPQATAVGSSTVTYPIIVKNATNANVTIIPPINTVKIDDTTRGFSNELGYSFLCLYPQQAITLASDGTNWFVLSYFAGTIARIGTTDNNYGNNWGFVNQGLTDYTNAVIAANRLTLNEEINVVKIGSSNKGVKLPNPSTWTKGDLLVIIISETSNADVDLYFDNTDQYIGELNQSYSRFLAENANKGQAITFLKGATKWYVISRYNTWGYLITSTRDTTNSENTLDSTKELTFIENTNIWVNIPTLSFTDANKARLYYVKWKNSTDHSHIQVTNGTIGSDSDKRLYFPNSGRQAISFMCFKTGGGQYQTFILNRYPTES